jgi:hypothetical protein
MKAGCMNGTTQIFVLRRFMHWQICNISGSRQGNLAYRAGTHRGRRRHAWKKKMKKKSFFKFYAYIFLQNIQKFIAIHFCFPFIDMKENACFWHFTKNISPRRRVIIVAACFLGRLNLILNKPFSLKLTETYWTDVPTMLTDVRTSPVTTILLSPFGLRGKKYR